LWNGPQRSWARAVIEGPPESAQLPHGIGRTDDRMGGQIAEDLHAGRRHGRSAGAEEPRSARSALELQRAHQFGGQLVATGLAGDQ
jgi:hypothetical protein